jgi:hypothetical protein
MTKDLRIPGEGTFLPFERKSFSPPSNLGFH